jgi:hypothetical protein
MCGPNQGEFFYDLVTCRSPPNCTLEVLHSPQCSFLGADYAGIRKGLIAEFRLLEVVCSVGKAFR